MKKLVLLFFILISPIFAGAGDSSKLLISGYVPAQADIRIKMNDNGKVEVSNFSSSQLRVEKINRMPASVRVTAP
jgi:hypothetical protein